MFNQNTGSNANASGPDLAPTAPPTGRPKQVNVVAVSGKNLAGLIEIQKFWNKRRAAHGAAKASLNEILGFLIEWELEGRAPKALRNARTGV